MRWVVAARQLSEQHRCVRRHRQLAASTARMARVALLGRHWVLCLYDMLGTSKGLGVAAQAEVRWVQVRLARADLLRISSGTRLTGVCLSLLQAELARFSGAHAYVAARCLTRARAGQLWWLRDSANACSSLSCLVLKPGDP